MMAASPPCTLSVIVPMFNEEDNVRPLVTAIRDALGSAIDWELLLVEDGSRDDTAARMVEAAAEDPRVHPLFLARNYGQTQATQAGFDHARGRVLVTMDGDLQNDPQDIPSLVSLIEQGYDMVAGYRERRQDAALTRLLPSRIANRMIRIATGVPIRDNGCSLKAYRREVVRQFALYSDMHRFLPALASALAGARIVEVPVRHHPRRHGHSKYGLNRIFKVLADLVTLVVLRSFHAQPLRLFGGAGMAAILLGTASLGFLPFPASSGGMSPVVMVTAITLAFLLGGYLLLLGLVTELALRLSLSDRPEAPPQGVQE